MYSLKVQAILASHSYNTCQKGHCAVTFSVQPKLNFCLKCSAKYAKKFGQKFRLNHENHNFLFIADSTKIPINHSSFSPLQKQTYFYPYGRNFITFTNLVDLNSKMVVHSNGHISVSPTGGDTISRYVPLNLRPFLVENKDLAVR